MSRSLLAALGLFSFASAAQAAPQSWVLVTDMWGNPDYQSLVIDPDAPGLAATLNGRPIAGSLLAGTLSFTFGRNGGVARYTGQIKAGGLEGVAEIPDGNDSSRVARHRFTARRIEDKPGGGPRRIVFNPTSWSNLFDQHRAPVMTLWPGDTVQTTTVDSGGMDARGTTVAAAGNPQIGPFFVAGAEPGDTLAVKISRLRINRDFADSQDQIVARARGPALAEKGASLGRIIKWRLDVQAGLARPAVAEGAMAGYSIPVRPMLGGLAVAPGGGGAAVSTGDTGRWGGNMDFNEIGEGATVYLPVQQPGALLYMGDGHARQGDGETTQWALETSLDVEFTVELVKGPAIQTPRIESATEIMVLGQAGSLDEAVRLATDGLVDWLAKDYGLTLTQSAEILGVGVKYSIVTLAGRNAAIAARLEKALLPNRR